MVLDFLVHPEHGHYSYGAYHDQNIYNNYLKHLTELMQKSDFAILIKSMHQETAFSSFIPQIQQIYSGATIIRGRPHDLGEVHSSEWEKFVAAIKGKTDDEIRIHGCNFGECTRGFAMQLLGFLKNGRPWRKFKDRVENEKEEAEILLCQERGDFRASKIRYGITLAPSFPNANKVSIVPPGRWPKLPHGNINYQLTDEKSILFGPLVFPEQLSRSSYYSL